MLKYILKRLVALIPVIMGVTLLVFVIMQLAPGNPARMILGEMATPEQVAALEEEMGLNKPLLVRYFNYMLNFLRGDMGTSYYKSTSVVSEVMSRFPYTAKLAGVAAILTLIMSIPIGVMAAVKQNSVFDNASLVVTLLGISMPVFWLGLLLIITFSLKLDLFPTGGADTWKSYIMPAFCLAFSNMSTMARTTRSSMLETIRQDYVRTAAAKGVPRKAVILRHAFRNALIPTITVLGIQMSQLLGGSVVVETVFAWPGVGRLMIDSISSRDTPMVLGCIVLLTILFSVLNLVIDLCYAVADPRIKY
ncbi:MAG: ABC transporter permease [Eubacteriales bacterium]|nr:ABC transporter permease [Eubacteriales bacterium]MCI6979101.1 ABC transporter permease [Clostridiales bacterium]MDD6722074.1 ABC transporter permease [Clostridiales bacterium]